MNKKYKAQRSDVFTWDFVIEGGVGPLSESEAKLSWEPTYKATKRGGETNASSSFAVQPREEPVVPVLLPAKSVFN